MGILSLMNKGELIACLELEKKTCVFHEKVHFTTHRCVVLVKII